MQTAGILTESEGSNSMPAEVEIADDATREDVDDMVKEFMDERAELTDTDDDASKKAEETATDGDDTSAVDDDAAASQSEAGSEDSTTDDEAGQTDEGWLTDDVRAELPRWLSDEDLSGFSSRDEFDRALDLFARAAVSSGSEQTTGEPEQRQQERGQDGRYVKQQQQQEAGGEFEIDLDLSEFDEDLGERVKGALIGLRDHYEGRMGALDQRLVEMESLAHASEEAALEAQFDRVVDSLEYSDLFGKTGEESEKQLADRQKLLEHAVAFMEGPKPFGQDVTLEEATKLMFKGLFHDHISKRTLKNKTRRVQQQANMRTGVGAERPGEAEFKGPLKRHPDVQRAYKALQESLGDD
jgi:hypothetical protein